MPLRPRRKSHITVALLTALVAGPLGGSGAEAQSGSYLAQRLTKAPAQAVYLTSIDDFDRDGGTATIDPGSDRAEVISYNGVDRSASALTGVARAEPRRHSEGVPVVPAESESEPDPSPSPDGSPSPSPSLTPKPDQKPDPKKEPAPSVPEPSPTSEEPATEPPGCGDCGDGEFFWAGPSDPNSYSSGALADSYAGFVSLGISEERARRLAYAPFIIAGAADWSDSWGAPRFDPGRPPRPHQGQDVFCSAGDPLLAAVNGRIEFASGGLGGRVARLHVSEGGYLYYAHLDDFNDELASGNRVRIGDVIGYCGNTGNARGSSPHVHFGWYDSAGVAQDPMSMLVDLLRKAERRAGKRLASLRHDAARRAETAELERLFGDELVSPPVELEVPAPELESVATRLLLEELGLLPA